MKKLWVVALVGTLLLTGCSGNNNKQAASKSSEAVRSTKTVAKTTKAKKVTKAVRSTRSAVAVKASSQAESSSQVSAIAPSVSQTTPAVTRSSQSTTQTTPVATTVWNATKTQQLSAFMGQWQAMMGQTYQGTYDGATPNHLGIVFPNAITSGQLNGRVSLGGQAINLSWSTNGENGQAYQVVAVATGNKNQFGFPTTYLFCIHNQQPVVYMSQTTNGGTLYIQNTQNAALQAGFAKIVTE